MAFLMTIKDNITAAISSIYITCVCLTLGSGFLRLVTVLFLPWLPNIVQYFRRSIKGLQSWLFYITYATQVRYAAAFLNRQIFLSSILPDVLPYDSIQNCTTSRLIETSVFTATPNLNCKYATRAAFLTDRYSRDPTDVIFSGILDVDVNLGATFAFSLGMIIFNMFLYLIPLPTHVKAKFRE